MMFIPMRVLWVGTHIATYRSLCGGAFISPTPVFYQLEIVTVTVIVTAIVIVTVVGIVVISTLGYIHLEF